MTWVQPLVLWLLCLVQWVAKDGLLVERAGVEKEVANNGAEMAAVGVQVAKVAAMGLKVVVLQYHLDHTLQVAVLRVAGDETWGISHASSEAADVGLTEPLAQLIETLGIHHHHVYSDYSYQKYVRTFI